MQVVLFICACFSIILQNCTCAEMHVHAWACALIT
jgi:hypothetical protein